MLTHMVFCSENGWGTTSRMLSHVLCSPNDDEPYHMWSSVVKMVEVRPAGWWAMSSVAQMMMSHITCGPLFKKGCSFWHICFINPAHDITDYAKDQFIYDFQEGLIIIPSSTLFHSKVHSLNFIQYMLHLVIFLKNPLFCS